MIYTVFFRADREITVDADDSEDAIKRAQEKIADVPADWEWVDVENKGV